MNWIQLKMLSLAGGLILLAHTVSAVEPADPAEPAVKLNQTELATLGGGCFWCVEAVFESFYGVKDVVSGYAGGFTPNPTYQQIMTGRTGHAEVVQITYDPQAITYADLLDIFWEAHDPTTLNRQGPDVGPQYRSIVLYHNEEQKRIAEESKRNAAPRFNRPIVTQIVPLRKFYRAEEYHQDYFKKNPNAPYCVAVIRPKLQKLENLIQQWNKSAAGQN